MALIVAQLFVLISVQIEEILLMHIKIPPLQKEERQVVIVKTKLLFYIIIPLNLPTIFKLLAIQTHHQLRVIYGDFQFTRDLFGEQQILSLFRQMVFLDLMKNG